MIYRIKLVDVNKQVSYSRTVSLQSPDAATGSYIKSISANNTDNVSVCFQSAGEKTLTMLVVDIAGNVLYTNKQHASKGSNTISVPVNRALSKGGVYFVQLSDGSDNFAAKFSRN